MREQVKHNAEAAAEADRFAFSELEKSLNLSELEKNLSLSDLALKMFLGEISRLRAEMAFQNPDIRNKAEELLNRKEREVRDELKHRKEKEREQANLLVFIITVYKLYATVAEATVAKACNL